MPRHLQLFLPLGHLPFDRFLVRNHLRIHPLAHFLLVLQVEGLRSKLWHERHRYLNSRIRSRIAEPFGNLIFACVNLFVA